MIGNVDTIRKDSDILKVISSRIELKKEGSSYKACCPFHGEKTPSFSVNPAKNIFKCFGCGEGGDAVHFIMEYDDCSYGEALKIVADICNINVEYQDKEKATKRFIEEKEKKEKRQTLLPLIRLTAEWYHQKGLETFKRIGEGEDLQYDLFGRTYKTQTIIDFQIGVSPNGSPILKHAKKNAWDIEKLKQVGIVKDGERGTYDFFYNRLIFPIHSPGKGEKKVLAFGGRIKTKKSKQAKYINSPDSVVYNKSELLYGLKQNKRQISKDNLGYLVEGYTDVLTMYDNGYPAVASCGTALTDQQCRLLKKYCSKIVVLRDGDEAGKEASIRDVEILVRNGFDVKVLRIPDTIKTMDRVVNKLKINDRFREKLKNDWYSVKKINHLAEDDKTIPKAKRGSYEIVTQKKKVVLSKDTIVELYKSSEKEDPDSFLRKHGKQAFSLENEVSMQDGIVWFSSIDLNKEDPFSVEASIKQTAKLISSIQSPIRRDHYVNILSKGCFSGKRRYLQELINHCDNEKLRKAKPIRNREDLDSVQERDIMNYGIYIRNNGNGDIFFKREKGNQTPLTNFLITPIYHINSIENPTKIINIKNEHGIARTVDIHTDYFGDFKKFKLKLLEYGNYRFMPSCRAEDYHSIMGKIIEESYSCYKINTLGYHRKGFYTWNNGITHPDGSYQECSENGLVEFEGIRYILPGRTVTNKNDDSYDNDDTENKYIDLFTYKPSEYTLEQWSGKVLSVFGENGLMAIAYYLSALYRDIIFSKFNFFPHLDFFGPPQRGKSALAWTLSYMFGQARQPLDLSDFTAAGFNSRGQQIRNGIMWCDEYQNDIDMWKMKRLRGAYDNTGKEKRTLRSNKSTENQNGYCAILITGQDLPTREIALLTRCITLVFNYQRTDEGDKKLTALRALEKTGMFAGITSYLQKYRQQIEDEFAIQFDEIKGIIQSRLINSSIVSARLINNHVIPLTTFAILAKHESFPMYGEKTFFEALVEFTAQIIHRQATAIIKQDEVGGFWNFFNYFKSDNRIRHDKDFLVEKKGKVRIKIQGTRADTELKVFEAPKKLLFLRFTRIHPMYEEQMGKQGRKRFDEATLKYYLATSQAFIGELRAKKFEKNKATASCYVFDVEKLGFDIELSIEATQIEDPPLEAWREEICEDCNKKKKDCNCLEKDEDTPDTPF